MLLSGAGVWYLTSALNRMPAKSADRWPIRRCSRLPLCVLSSEYGLAMLDSHFRSRCRCCSKAQLKNVLGDAPMYAGRTDFRSTASRYAWTAVLAIGLCAATYLIYSSDGFTWISLSFMAFSVIGVLAVLEALTSYVRIDGNVLRLCRTFRQYSVEKAEIETISSAKGCPMLLVMRDGSKLEVPSLGANSIENSLRAWLRAA